MFKVKVPASSANLGCGFDVLGIALGLYNEYTFEKNGNFELEGFMPRYLDLSKNMVLSCYKKTFDYVGKKPIEVKINEIQRDIPRSGGLGSSAACVVAGVLGANYFMDNVLSKDDLFTLATKIEGHPDNISAALFGGLNACYKTEKGFKAEKYSVNEKLKFLICYPDFYVSTESARAVLPKNILLTDAVENLSHIVNIPRAFANGDITLLKECVKDKLHEPYRMKLIEDSQLIKKAAENVGAVSVISGSGAAMLVISDNEDCFDEIKKIETKHKWTFSSVSPCFEV